MMKVGHVHDVRSTQSELGSSNVLCAAPYAARRVSGFDTLYACHEVVASPNCMRMERVLAYRALAVEHKKISQNTANQDVATAYERVATAYEALAAELEEMIKLMSPRDATPTH